MLRSAGCANSPSCFCRIRCAMQLAKAYTPPNIAKLCTATRNLSPSCQYGKHLQKRLGKVKMYHKQQIAPHFSGGRSCLCIGNLGEA